MRDMTKRTIKKMMSAVVNDDEPGLSVLPRVCRVSTPSSETPNSAAILAATSFVICSIAQP